MIEVAPGVHSINLPLPWELDTVNVHVVQLEDGWMLVDSGFGTDECFAALEKGLAEGGLGWKDIRKLCITHMHPDHVGLAAHILDLTRGDLLMHHQEAEYLAQSANTGRNMAFFDRALASAGTPAELQDRVHKSFTQIRASFRKLDPAWPLHGGERLKVAHGTIEFVWTPGHSPGHLCLYSLEHKYLISGDHILEHITPNITWHPEKDTLGQYLESLSMLIPYPIETVLPSHGGPFRGHAEWIRATHQHHEERCGQILGVLAKSPTTAHHVVEEMWQKKLSAFHYHFAVLEILAHLEYMRRLGRVSGSPGADQAVQWAPAA